MGLVGDFVGLKWRFAHLRGAALAAWQERETGRLLAFARAKCPWWAERLGSSGPLPPFEAIPEMDKAAFMANFDRLNTRGLVLDELMAFALEMEASKDFRRWYRHPEGGRVAEYSVGLSSGTSGNKGITVTPRSLARRLPAVFAARGGLPLRLLPFRVLFILRVDNQAFAQIDTPLVSFRHVYSMTPPADIIRRCNEAGANVIIGPPSVLRLLVPELVGLQRRLRLVISAAEVLHPEDARRLAGAFGCPVHQIYQTTEGPIASSCPHGSLHINEDLLRVELLDAEGRPVTRPGERSAKVLVTNLYQDIHPLVRYRMGDQVILGPPCRCGSGFRVIQEVVGRDDDVLWLKRRDGALQPVFPDLFSRWIITYNDAVREFQVIQADPGRLELHLRLDAGFDGRDRAAFLAGLEARLRGELGTYGCGGAAELALEFPAGGDFIQEPGGKFKRFIRGFPAG